MSKEIESDIQRVNALKGERPEEAAV